MVKSIIKLKNVSKFYYSKGVIATGFTKANLEFSMGEFVAIVGESGSGKSTLLNVISGLDTYEEGEMYINGFETSHYSEDDFEDYRRKYIGNIFQNFNLVNSYTVYQNVELVLLLNGAKKKDIRKKVIDLIKKVGLYKFRNTKVSKLSGGQKQRVAIARAMAKDTPIIIADEPTGNLDSNSALGIIKLLSEISKDKLVIIVTHNYEQVEDYVTRKIKMHDGRVLEDRVIKEHQDAALDQARIYKNLRFLSKIRLGIRNAFNIVPKFLLVLLVYLFITASLMSEYGSFKESEYISSKSGYNPFFKNTDDTRIVIKKNDGSAFSDDDYAKIKSIDNIRSIVYNDLLLSTSIDLSDDNYWISATVNNISNFNRKLDYGRMPENDNEIIVSGSKDDYYIGYLKDEILDKELYLRDLYTGELDKSVGLKIVGISYNDNSSYYYDDNSEIYVSDKVIDNLTYQGNQKYSNIRVEFQGKYYDVNNYDQNFRIVPKKDIQDGSVYISSDLNYLCKKENCINSALSIDVNNLYYSDTLELKVTKTYDKKNMESLVGIKDYDTYNGNIFISSNDYNKMFNKGNYQSSVNVANVEDIDSTITKLNKEGYNTLKISDTLLQDGNTEVLKIMRTIVTIILVVVLFFISYFVIRVILKSRNVYFATIRMLGANRKVSLQLLIIELLTVANLAYFTFIGILKLNELSVINVGIFNTILKYLNISDYVVIYAILIFISYLISLKFAKKLFKNSAMKTLKEEV